MEETQDIVAWLNSFANPPPSVRWWSAEYNKDKAKRAADEIERLRSEVSDLKRRHAIEDADTHGGMTQLLHRLEKANAERASICASLGIEPTDDPVEAISAWKAAAMPHIIADLSEEAARSSHDRLRARVSELEEQLKRVDVAETNKRAAMEAAREYETADADLRAARAQCDFYRARLHAEIEAHSLRAAKEKP